MLDQGYINHISLVLDASSSMNTRKNEVIKVTDNLIKYLAARSQELDQETRITIYKFNNTVECLIYDKDVLRLPSISQHYRPSGMTALVDATIKSQQDLSKTAELYGDHAFLTYVVTDGMENVSRNKPQVLSDLINRLPDHWTLAVMVPNQQGVFEAKKFGFPTNNIAIWDANSVQGIEEAASVIRIATDNFMVQRKSGVRGTKSIFDMSSANLNTKTVKSNLVQLKPSEYYEADVFNHSPVQIRDFVYGMGVSYQLGIAYYQLTKRESIQPNKQICIRNKKTGKVYSGQQARDILGLPNMEVKVSPSHNPEYDVFVQSTSVNRKLVPGTKVLVMR